MEVWHEGDYTGSGGIEQLSISLKAMLKIREISKKKEQIANKAMDFE
jgi:hypothetical protein